MMENLDPGTLHDTFQLDRTARQLRIGKSYFRKFYVAIQTAVGINHAWQIDEDRNKAILTMNLKFV